MLPFPWTRGDEDLSTTRDRCAKENLVISLVSRRHLLSHSLGSRFACVPVGCALCARDNRATACKTPPGISLSRTDSFFSTPRAIVHGTSHTGRFWLGPHSNPAEPKRERHQLPIPANRLRSSLNPSCGLGPFRRPRRFAEHLSNLAIGHTRPVAGRCIGEVAYSAHGPDRQPYGSVPSRAFLPRACPGYNRWGSEPRND